MVLRCHSKEEDELVPSHIQKMYNGCLGKFAGVTKSNAKVQDIVKVEEIPIDAEKKTKKGAPKKENPRSNTPKSGNAEDITVDWPKVTVFLDQLFFRTFLLFTVTEQLLFLIVFIYGYINH
jgi:hypothetical protein